MAKHLYETTDEQEAVLEYVVAQRNKLRDELDEEITVEDIIRTALDEAFATYGHDVLHARRETLIADIRAGKNDQLLELQAQEVRA
jgi:predicted dinucleotide-utilizing enzyme